MNMCGICLPSRGRCLSTQRESLNGHCGGKGRWSLWLMEQGGYRYDTSIWFSKPVLRPPVLGTAIERGRCQTMSYLPEDPCLGKMSGTWHMRATRSNPQFSHLAAGGLSNLSCNGWMRMRMYPWNSCVGPWNEIRRMG